MQTFSLEGKTALVVGASRGIGLAIAQHIAAAGAHTILAARSVDKLEKHASDIRGSGGRAESVALDVADADSIAAATSKLPDLDIFVGVSGTNLRKRISDYTPGEYTSIMRTNVDGFFLLSQRIGKRMIDRGSGGKVIFIGSLMSILGLPYLTVYAMSKAAIAGLTRTLAAEWGRHNIQVNCIAPGFVITDLNRQMWQREDLRVWAQGIQANPRVGTPEDIAPLAVFLSGRGSDYITGQVIAVDGGYSTTAVWPFEP
ncbi:MAG TPA: SDR family oxidoreductase [Bryobacteraceae bacterium]|nr:SDR family oxidoreductase [Bryobacteraceae bacterium]